MRSNVCCVKTNKAFFNRHASYCLYAGFDWKSGKVQADSAAVEAAIEGKGTYRGFSGEDVFLKEHLCVFRKDMLKQLKRKEQQLLQRISPTVGEKSCPVAVGSPRGSGRVLWVSRLRPVRRPSVYVAGSFPVSCSGSPQRGHPVFVVVLMPSALWCLLGARANPQPMVSLCHT